MTPHVVAGAKSGRDVVLVPGSALTLEHRDEYVRKALHFRLHEFDSQVCVYLPYHFTF